MLLSISLQRLLILFVEVRGDCNTRTRSDNNRGFICLCCSSQNSSWTTSHCLYILSIVERHATLSSRGSQCNDNDRCHDNKRMHQNLFSRVCNKTRDNFVTSRQFKQHELSLTHDVKPTDNQRNFTIDEAKPTASPGHHRIMEKLINCSQQRIRPTEAISSLMKAPFFSFEATISHKPWPETARGHIIKIF